MTALEANLTTASASAGSYHASPEKQVVIDHFDSPLIAEIRSQTQTKLRYFGLPGEEAQDIRAWRDSLAAVAAVERIRRKIPTMEETFSLEFPDIQCIVHFDEVDRVILENRGKSRTVGGQPYRPWVSTYTPPNSEAIAWNFDVVNLDYFGLFVPTPTEDQGAGVRAEALRKLFERDRQDSWKDWLLLITVEAQVQQRMRNELRAYLDSLRPDSSSDVIAALDFLLDNAAPEPIRSARLIHGVAAMLVSAGASNANLAVDPCGTVMYRGHQDEWMLHLAFRFRHLPQALAPQVHRLGLLRAPILQTLAPPQAPWFELIADQVPGVDEGTLRSCLACIDDSVVDAILVGWASEGGHS